MARKVCVVIPSYRADDTIERAIKSVLGQASVDVHVIVVVDDERPESAALVRSLELNNVSVIENERNSGAPFSRNAGLRACDAEFVMFLDSDDFVAGDLLGGLVEAMDKTKADVAFGPWLRLTEKQQLVQPFYRTNPDARQVFIDWLVQKRFTPPCGVLWRSQFLKAGDGWDENLKRNQDGELVLRSLLCGGRPAISDRGFGVYVNHGGENRITAKRENFSSLLLVADKLLAIESDLIPAKARADIVARYLYMAAANSFRRGDTQFGRAALARARALGFQGHRGSSVARAGAALLGLERYQRLAQQLKRR